MTLICEVSPEKVRCNHPSKYPTAFKERISPQIKRTLGRCEVSGCRSDTVLTVHHCDHDKHNNTHPVLGDDEATSNLVALCARCHLWAHGMERGYGVLTRRETLQRLGDRVLRFNRLSTTGMFGDTARKARRGEA